MSNVKITEQDIAAFRAKQEVEAAKADHVNASQQLDRLNKEAALTREINAKAELLEAQAFDVRAQGRHRQLICESMEKVNTLQALQIDLQIEAIKANAPRAAMDS